MELRTFFDENKRAALAFSGGVDSSYLLYAGLSFGAEIAAYYVDSEFQPRFEREDAERLARELKIKLNILPLDVLADERIKRNDAQRCYYCKNRIFSLIAEAARADGYDLLLDGTNASDDEADRPGMRALCELSVRSPLRECGLTKTRIRELSKDLGLFTHDKPAYACLASRIPEGTEITAEMLQKSEAAEDYLRELGFSDFRVRYFDGSARISVKAEQLPMVLRQRGQLLRELKKYYRYVMLDLEERK